MNHWALKYLGKKWCPIDGFGPDGFHCWGLLWYVYQQELGVTLPKFTGVNANDYLDVHRRITHGVEEAMAHENGWGLITQEEARDFAAVAMSRGGKVIHHVGIYTPVDGGLVVHADDSPTGVKAESVQSLRRQWNRILFFKYHGNSR